MLTKNVYVKYFFENKLLIKCVLARKRKSIPLNRYPYSRRSWKERRNASTFSFQKLIVLFLDLKLYFSVAFTLRTTTIPLI